MKSKNFSGICSLLLTFVVLGWGFTRSEAAEPLTQQQELEAQRAVIQAHTKRAEKLDGDLDIIKKELRLRLSQRFDGFAEAYGWVSCEATAKPSEVMESLRWSKWCKLRGPLK